MDDAISLAFLETLARIQWPGWKTERHAYGFIGKEFDALSQNPPVSNWNYLRRDLHAQLRTIQPKFQFAVLAMARDEAPYLAEWIAHYLSIGAEHIFIYTNDNRDGTDELLNWFSSNAPVTVLHTTAAPGINIQLKNYEHALFLVPELRLYEWIAVVDADEFLVPDAQFNHHLPKFLDTVPANAGAILFPWNWRLWNTVFDRSPGLLAERYQHATWHKLFKPVLRFRFATSLCAVHVPTLDVDVEILDSARRPIQPSEIWSNDHKAFDGGYIDHYWGRSFEEFAIKKIRGDLLAIPEGQFHRPYEIFFGWSNTTSENNYMPSPDEMMNRVKQRLKSFEDAPEYLLLIKNLELRYKKRAAQLRPGLWKIYNDARLAHESAQKKLSNA